VPRARPLSAQSGGEDPDDHPARHPRDGQQRGDQANDTGDDERVVGDSAPQAT
jgi:hypothetical protein